MPVALLELPSALETIAIVTVGSVVALLGVLVSWAVVTSVLAGLNRLIGR